MNKKESTCCFTGHRQLPMDKIEHILRRLNDEIDRLIGEGVTTYLSGGALGFDQMAAALIAAKKEMGYNIRLMLVLPNRDQDKLWPEKDKPLYGYLLQSADEVYYISDIYTNSCARERNYYMVEHSAYCICALLRDRSGTIQTVRYAEQKNLHIINVANPK